MLDFFAYLELLDLLNEKIEALAEESKKSLNWTYYAKQISKYERLKYILKKVVE